MGMAAQPPIALLVKRAKKCDSRRRLDIIEQVSGNMQAYYRERKKTASIWNVRFMECSGYSATSKASF